MRPGQAYSMHPTYPQAHICFSVYFHTKEEVYRYQFTKTMLLLRLIYTVSIDTYIFMLEQTHAY